MLHLKAGALLSLRSVQRPSLAGDPCCAADRKGQDSDQLSDRSSGRSGAASLCCRQVRCTNLSPHWVTASAACQQWYTL